VRLSPEPINNGIKLSWTAKTPWYNYRYDGRMHYIYRKEFGQLDFLLIDSVSVATDIGRYEDFGQWNGVPLDCEKDYCYKVPTNGSYYNPVLPEPLLNFSQEACERPSDSIPPNPPVLSHLPQDCDNFVFGSPNRLFWEKNPNLPINPCDSLIKEYRLYYAAFEGQQPQEMLVASPDTFYIHFMQNNNAGCYEVTAVDYSDVESERSNRVCIDNCFYFELPNVITPNGDGSNDFFKPIPIPRFVKKVEVVFFNRWGVEIAKVKNDPDINWNGTNNAGQKVPDGVYFYKADVYFRTLNASETPQVYKGWVQILR
jgi:gliding motility-associated-like protein